MTHDPVEALEQIRAVGMWQGGHCGEDTSEIISRKRRNRVIKEVQTAILAALDGSER
jgi:hypothetical protein